MSKPHEQSDLEEFRKMLTGTSPSDFDGHSEFDRLTPEEKLMWLSQIAQFIFERRGARVASQK